MKTEVGCAFSAASKGYETHICAVAAMGHPLLFSVNLIDAKNASKAAFVTFCTLAWLSKRQIAKCTSKQHEIPPIICHIAVRHSAGDRLELPASSIQYGFGGVFWDSSG